MSALGQEQTFASAKGHVRFTPNSGQTLHRNEMTIGRPPPCDDGMRSIAPSWF